MKRRNKSTLKSLKAKCWKLLSQIVRFSAADHRGIAECYTCGTQDLWRSMDAGHAIGGRHNAVLFDEEIIRCQCKICNVWKRGNYTVYTTKLIQENGIEWMENKLIQSRIPMKYSIGDLELKIEEYEKRLEELNHVA